jgi:polysaccharide biosynthesis/export protein
MGRLLVVLSFAAVAFPQTNQAVTPEISIANIPANLPVQPIGPNDLISVTVYDAPEFSRTVRVGPDGNIRFPMLKTRIPANGKLPSELETAIADALEEADLIIEPFVTVGIVEYHSRPISVAGAVRRPLTFQAEGPVRLLDALTRAQGLSESAGNEILVTLPPESDGDADAAPFIRRIPVKGLIDDANPDLNLLLTGGEEIRVPDVGRVYVVGNVNKPGAYPLHDASDTTVLKILALSEGLTSFASKKAFIYRQEGGAGGTKSEIPIELKQIMGRKSPDVALEANDILYIPDNSGRRIAVTALERIVLFGTTAGATAVAIRR